MASKKTSGAGGSGKNKTNSGKVSVRRSGPRSRAAATRRARTRGTAKSADEKARELALAIAAIGLEKRALNVEIIDVRGKVDYSDYVVVMSGRSDRQVNALADHVLEHLSAEYATRCIGLEGLPNGSWVLMDYGDVIVHVFHEDTRGYYDLESLWIDAARVSVE